MPKSKNNRSRFNGAVQSESRSVIVPFRKYVVYTTGVTATRMQNLAVPSSALGDRVTEIGDNFLHWRFRRLRISSTLSAGGNINAQQFGSPAVTNYLSNGVVHMIAFAMMDTSKLSATPSTEQATQLPCFKLGDGYHTISFTVPPRILMKGGTVPWFETQATGSESATFQIPAFAWSATVLDHTVDGDVSQHLLIEGDIEFRDPVDSTISALVSHAGVPSAEEEKTIERDEDSDYAEYVRMKRAAEKAPSVASLPPENLAARPKRP
jgi:hypothetical protein